MLNFVFLEKSLGIVSAPYFLYQFSRKCFSSYNILTDQDSLAGFLFFLEILVNICIAIVC